MATHDMGPETREKHGHAQEYTKMQLPGISPHGVNPSGRLGTLTNLWRFDACNSAAPLEASPKCTKNKTNDMGYGFPKMFASHIKEKSFCLACNYIRQLETLTWRSNWYTKHYRKAMLSVPVGLQQDVPKPWQLAPIISKVLKWHGTSVGPHKIRDVSLSTSHALKTV